jgi:hypothetical protein
MATHVQAISDRVAATAYHLPGFADYPRGCPFSIESLRNTSPGELDGARAGVAGAVGAWNRWLENARARRELLRERVEVSGESCGSE